MNYDYLSMYRYILKLRNFIINVTLNLSQRRFVRTRNIDVWITVQILSQ